MEYLKLANLADEICARIDESHPNNAMGWVQEAEKPSERLSKEIGYDKTPLWFYREHSSRTTVIWGSEPFRHHTQTIMRTYDPVTEETQNLVIGIQFDGEPWWRIVGSKDPEVACQMFEDYREYAQLSLKRWARWARTQVQAAPKPQPDYPWETAGVTLSVKTERISRLAWDAPNHSIEWETVKDKTQYDITEGVAKRVLRNFKPMIEHGWEMSLAGESFTIRSISE